MLDLEDDSFYLAINELVNLQRPLDVSRSNQIIENPMTCGCIWIGRPSFLVEEVAAGFLERET